MPSGNPSACTVSTCPARQKSGCTEPALAICRVCFSSFQTAKSMVTYCESILRSCSESFSCFNIVAGERDWVGGRAHDAANQRCIQHCRRRLAAHVSHRDADTCVVVMQEIVEVSPDGAGREKPGGELGGRLTRGVGRQQPQLYFAGHVQIVFQTLFL